MLSKMDAIYCTPGEHLSLVVCAYYARKSKAK